MGVEEGGKKRTRRVQKFQKAIVGMSLDDIKQKKAQRPQVRQAAKEQAAKEAKAKYSMKAKAKPKATPKDAQKKGKDGKQDKAPKGGAGAAKKDFKGKK